MLKPHVRKLLTPKWCSKSRQSIVARFSRSPSPTSRNLWLSASSAWEVSFRVLLRKHIVLLILCCSPIVSSGSPIVSFEALCTKRTVVCLSSIVMTRNHWQVGEDSSQEIRASPSTSSNRIIKKVGSHHFRKSIVNPMRGVRSGFKGAISLSQLHRIGQSAS